MSDALQDAPSNITEPLVQLTHSLNAMHLAQLTAFAFSVPQLYFCREVLALVEEDAIAQCLQRLNSGLINQDFTLETLTCLLTEREYFDAGEARLRLTAVPASQE